MRAVGTRTTGLLLCQKYAEMVVSARGPVGCRGAWVESGGRFWVDSGLTLKRF
jgi:hypothetical protein